MTTKTPTYVAHVVTEADGLGDPEIIVMTQPDETGAADPIVSYPLPEGTDPMRVLAENGWRPAGEPTTEPYLIVDVEPVDWAELVRRLTYEREAARIELERRDMAWRRVIADAMCTEGVRRQSVADAAKVTLTRAYQIRDGRR